jgi:hypothetical protein
MKMSRVFRIVIVADCVFASLIAFNLFADSAWALGKFSLTCRNTRISISTLSASCATANGEYKDTSINLNPYIGNTDGSLKWTDTNFIETCRATSLISPSILAAQCKTRDQIWTSTRINLDDHIANIDGTLKFE